MSCKFLNFLNCLENNTIILFNVKVENLVPNEMPIKIDGDSFFYD